MNANQSVSAKSLAFLFATLVAVTGASSSGSHVVTAMKAPKPVVLTQAERPSERLAEAENPSDRNALQSGTRYARGAENPSDVNARMAA